MQPAANVETLEQLASLDRSGLESLLRSGDGRPASVPTGLYRGHYLCWIDARPWRHPLVAAVFRHVPFGVDFDACLWFFGHPRLALGRFTPQIGRSRWRDTEIVSLRYDISRLPGLIRRQLYDEVLPLSADLCLGIGGLNAPRGEGDLFLFALERIP